ncbi:MAG: AraC family transcriptional regulator [Gammaproteobacteria bacterium]|nr:AraC family transcriptional regulator [Gammaproteobacteria bacterium]
MSETIFNFHDTILIATAIQSSLFVLLILIAKYEHHVSDYFLVGFFIAQTFIPLHLLVNFGASFKFIAMDISPALYHLFDIAYWLEGPLLLWYTRSILYKQFSLSPKDALFLIPSLGYALYIGITFFAVDTSAQMQFIQQRNAPAPSIYHAVEAIREAVRVFFGVLCLIEISRAQRRLRDHYASIENIDFTWLSFLVIAFTAVRGWILFVVIYSIYAPELDPAVFNYLGLTGNYLTFALISTLMFFSLQRSSLFGGQVNYEARAEEEVIDPALTRRIESYMATEKPYLKHLLNLEQLARELDMHPRSLSHTIKTHFQTNFYEFINTYRIETAKVILADPEQSDKTMIDILGECGFNSKATYNTFFKKMVGTTPTQFRQAQLKKKA